MRRRSASTTTRRAETASSPTLPPLIAIPTTAGTGSEVSRSGVAFLEDTGRKTVIFAPALLPRAAIVDPELTYGLPARATAATGLDAFTHCLEAYLSNGFHPLADAVAIDGIRRVSRSLPVALQEPTHSRARLDMMIAAMEGAMAFQKGLGNAHALAHALTPVAGLHHGLANAVVLPSVMAFNRGVSRSRLARVAIAMGEPSGAVEDVLAGLAIDRVRRLVADAGLPTRLSQAGVKEPDLPRIAAARLPGRLAPGEPTADDRGRPPGHRSRGVLSSPRGGCWPPAPMASGPAGPARAPPDSVGMKSSDLHHHLPREAEVDGAEARAGHVVQLVGHAGRLEPLVGEEDVDLHRPLRHGYPVGLAEHRLVGGTLHRVVVLAHRELPDHALPRVGEHQAVLHLPFAGDDLHRVPGDPPDVHAVGRRAGARARGPPARLRPRDDECSQPSPLSGR